MQVYEYTIAHTDGKDTGGYDDAGGAFSVSSGWAWGSQKQRLPGPLVPLRNFEDFTIHD